MSLLHRRIYLDHASTTPIDSVVYKAMVPFFQHYYANPSALYKEGVAMRRVVDGVRTSIARILNIKSEEVYFTASGTEADNMAIVGVFEKALHLWAEGTEGTQRVQLDTKRPHIITTNIEHPGILEVCRQYVERKGGDVTYIEVEENGIVDPLKIKAALRPSTVLVSVMYANNEIGTIQPLRDIARVIEEYKKEQRSVYPIFHTDASQAGNYLDLNFAKVGVDMMTLDGSKIYGPKGVGVLAMKRHVPASPLIYGGGQERGVRAGTENVAGIVGFGIALERTVALRERESQRVKMLKDFFIEKLAQICPAAHYNGDREMSLPNTVNVCIPGIDAELAVLKFDHKGIAISAASACMNNKEHSESYVIQALDKKAKAVLDKKNVHTKNPNDCSASSLRFTFGRSTTLSDIKLTLKVFEAILTTQ
jgi:cysteine desulfurase